MCYVESVCHTPCGHWSERITTAGACPKAKSVGSVRLPCGQKVPMGMANDTGACWKCSKWPNTQPHKNLQVEFNDAYLDPQPSPKAPIYGIVDDFPSRFEEPLHWGGEVDAKSGVAGLEGSPRQTQGSRSARTSVKSTESALHRHNSTSSTTVLQLPRNQRGQPTVQSDKSTALGVFERGLFAPHSPSS